LSSTAQSTWNVKFLVHRRMEYQAFPKRHSTAINRNGKHAEGKAITEVQEIPFEACLKQGTTSTSGDVNFAFMLLCMIGTSKSTHLLVLNLHGNLVHKSYALVLADCCHIGDTIALISTTSELAGKDHV
jgi:hypothetical protein